MKKKIVAMVTSLVLVATLAIGGTLAWLTHSTGPVTNTFTVNSTGVAATLDEAKVSMDTETGEYVASNTRTNGNVYQNVYPGAVLPKDPTVHVSAGSEACYVYMAVYNDLGDNAVIKTGGAEGNVGVNSAWTRVEGVSDPNVTLYVYTDTGTAPVAVVGGTEKIDLPALFDTVVIKNSITNMSAIANMKIVVNGYAHQSTGVDVDTANAAAIAWANTDSNWPAPTTPAT